MASAPDRKKSTRKRKAASPKKTKSSREKVAAHRRRLRAQGLRPIQIWVPDTRSERFAKEAHRQAARVAASAQAGEDQAFIDAIGDAEVE